MHLVLLGTLFATAAAIDARSVAAMFALPSIASTAYASRSARLRRLIASALNWCASWLLLALNALHSHDAGGRFVSAYELGTALCVLWLCAAFWTESVFAGIAQTNAALLRDREAAKAARRAAADDSASEGEGEDTPVTTALPGNRETPTSGSGGAATWLSAARSLFTGALVFGGALFTVVAALVVFRRALHLAHLIVSAAIAAAAQLELPAVAVPRWIIDAAVPLTRGLGVLALTAAFIACVALVLRHALAFTADVALANAPPGPNGVPAAVFHPTPTGPSLAQRAATDNVTFARTRASLPADLRERLQAARVATYAPHFPTGWFRLCDVADVPPGAVRSFTVFERELVAFRGNSADAPITVCDAFCPHMGAHLGVGGEVVGDSLQCPFHKWQFDAGGCVKHIPYCDAPPPAGRKLATWHSRTYYGFVLVWHDAEGRAPTYEPPAIPDIDDGTLVPRGGTTPPPIAMHLQEFAENSADTSHFAALHDRAYIPYTTIPIPGVTVHHKTDWQGPARGASTRCYGGEETLPGGATTAAHYAATGEVAFMGPHLAHFIDTVYIRLCGVDVLASTTKAVITFVGPGGLAFFRFAVPGIGTIHMFQTMTPQGLMRQRVDFKWFAPAHESSLAIHYVVRNWIANFVADVAVWETKLFVAKPLLVKGDGPVMAMRRWYSQFYAPGAATRAIAADKPTPAATTLREVEPAPELLVSRPASPVPGAAAAKPRPPAPAAAAIELAASAGIRHRGRAPGEGGTAAGGPPDGRGLISPACDWMDF